MKGLVFVFALLFVAVSAQFWGADDYLDEVDETAENFLKCISSGYGRNLTDSNDNHNATQLTTCFLSCGFVVNGVVNDDDTLNIPSLEKTFADEIATGDFPVVKVFTETYYGCKKDYPEHCDWLLCLNRRLQPYYPAEVSKDWFFGWADDNGELVRNVKVLGDRTFALLNKRFSALKLND